MRNGFRVSILGPSAAGKTTLVRRLQREIPGATVLSRDGRADMVLTPSLFQDRPRTSAEYVSLYRRAVAEIARVHTMLGDKPAIWDRGPEDLEFKLRLHPTVLGTDWNPETLLGPELAGLATMRSNLSFFLDASSPCLATRAHADRGRVRTDFRAYLECVLELERRWYNEKRGVIKIDTAAMTAEEVGHAVLAFIRHSAVARAASETCR